jgi:secretion/DNA translocation related TadE-like protein
VAPPANDEGSVSVIGVTLIAAALSLLTLAGSVGGWATMRTKAGMVADLAALAAARSGVCSSAQEVALLHGALLDGCTTEAGDVIVTVTLPAAGPLSLAVSRRARSGY